MSPFRSVGARLAAALALVVAVALGVAWVVVVPSLERNLTRVKLNQQASRASVAMRDFPVFSFENPAAGPEEVADWAAEHGAVTNTRVVVFAVRSREPEVRLDVAADSRQDIVVPDPVADRIAVSAALYGRPSRGVVSHEGQRYAEVALPVQKARAVVLFSSSLEDTLASVQQVKRRLLLAGGLALGIALALGYGAASV
ncbi:MAG: hypothetical protein WD249_00425, partial [Gaiellaceae bacterium]